MVFNTCLLIDFYIEEAEAKIQKWSDQHAQGHMQAVVKPGFEPSQAGF